MLQLYVPPFCTISILIPIKYTKTLLKPLNHMLTRLWQSCLKNMSKRAPHDSHPEFSAFHINHERQGPEQLVWQASHFTLPPTPCSPNTKKYPSQSKDAPFSRKLIVTAIFKRCFLAWARDFSTALLQRRAWSLSEQVRTPGDPEDVEIKHVVGESYQQSPPARCPRTGTPHFGNLPSGLLWSKRAKIPPYPQVFWQLSCWSNDITYH